MTRDDINTRNIKASANQIESEKPFRTIHPAKYFAKIIYFCRILSNHLTTGMICVMIVISHSKGANVKLNTKITHRQSLTFCNATISLNDTMP